MRTFFHRRGAEAQRGKGFYVAALFCLCVSAPLRLNAQVPPPPPTNAPFAGTFTNSRVVQIGTNLYVAYLPPQPQPAATGTQLSWDPYTNLFVTVTASTNLADWYFKTNVPIWQTNVVIPFLNPYQPEFYRIGCNYVGPAAGTNH